MNALSEKLDLLISNLDKVLHENKRNKTIEDFEEDLATMLNIAQDCAMLNQQFIHLHQEVNAHLSASKKKVQEAEEKVLDTEQKYKVLKIDLVRTCQCIEDFEENELKFKEKIADLEDKLTQILEEKDVAVTRTEVVSDAETDKEKKLLTSRLTLLENSLTLKEEHERELNSKLKDSEATIEKLENSVDELRLKLKDELERSKKVVKDKVYVEKEARDKDLKIEELEKSTEDMGKKVEELKSSNDNLKRKVTFHLFRISAMKERTKKAEIEVTQQMKSFKNIIDEKDKLALIIEKKEDDIKTLNQKLINTNNDKEAYLQKCLRLQSQKQNSDERARFLKIEYTNLEKEIMNLKKQISQHNAEVANVNREKELLAKNIFKMESLMKKYDEDFKKSENEKITLHKDLKDAKLQIEKQNHVISTLETLKSQLLSDIKSLTKKIEALNDELSTHEDAEITLKQQIAELSSKLNQQIQISSAALLDRKMFCQQYKEMKENRDEMKQKVENLDNYVNELKEMLSNRNKEIKEWKNKFEKADLQNKNLNSQLAQRRSEYEFLVNEHKHLEELLNGHLKNMSRKDKDIQILQAKVNNLTEECKILNSRVHRQSNEINSLEEKLRFSENMVEAEKEKFESYQNSTKILELEILRLTSEKNSLITRINDLEKLKKSFSYARDELHKERFKNSALERAMQRPINVHRWRLLRGNDPEKYQLIENCQTVQKQLLKKCAESEEKDKKLSEMNKLIQQLKTMTLRQKDLEEKYMQDARLKVRLKSKTDQIKALKFETNMYMSYMSSCQAEIKHLNQELQKMKTRQFLRQKSKVSPKKEETLDDDETPERIELVS